MSRRLLYGCTIFTSSLLLFLVQPLMAKAILPWFGGSAGVWTTAMLFFQSLLLLGYLYAHLTTRHMVPSRQAGVHLLLLAVSLLLIPITPTATWKPGPDTEPITRILAILTVSVGLPYFLLSTTGPLVQSWYARRAKAAFPYRLFAISNLASLAALIGYPVWIEPLIPVPRQMQVWSAAYAGFVLLAGAAALLSGRAPAAPVEAKTAPPFSTRLLWIALAACPSVLWLGIANELSQNVAPVPFLWMLPLSIYLLTFVLCFDRDGWYRPVLFRVALPVAWVLIAYCLSRTSSALALKWNIVMFSGGLFLCCMFCHGELAKRKPHPTQLTSFYLMVATGGALGGIFVGVIAPNVFNRYLELPAALIGCILLALGLLYGYPPRRLARLALTAALGFVLAGYIDSRVSGELLRVRNFHGTLQVSGAQLRDSPLRVLSNGPIEHGTQFLSPALSRTPTTYYGPESGPGLAATLLPDRPRRVGVIGLGAGTLACYARAGDFYRFYEINTAVIRIANTEFRYLRECPARYDVIQGDGRLSLEREPPQNFDLLAVDAFNGDSIPVHLLTREAFALYFSHIKPDGVLAAHVTNRYLDLTSVVRALAADCGRTPLLIHNAAEPGRGIYEATWILLTANAALLRSLSGVAVPFPAARTLPLWTDSYSNLFQVLR